MNGLDRGRGTRNAAESMAMGSAYINPENQAVAYARLQSGNDKLRVCPIKCEMAQLGICYMHNNPYLLLVLDRGFSLAHLYLTSPRRYP